MLPSLNFAGETKVQNVRIVKLAHHHLQGDPLVVLRAKLHKLPNWGLIKRIREGVLEGGLWALGTTLLPYVTMITFTQLRGFPTSQASLQIFASYHGSGQVPRLYMPKHMFEGLMPLGDTAVHMSSDNWESVILRDAAGAV